MWVRFAREAWEKRVRFSCICGDTCLLRGTRVWKKLLRCTQLADSHQKRDNRGFVLYLSAAACIGSNSKFQARAETGSTLLLTQLCTCSRAVFFLFFLRPTITGLYRLSGWLSSIRLHESQSQMIISSPGFGYPTISPMRWVPRR